VLPAGSSDFEDVTQVEVDQTVGREGLVDEARLRFAGLELAVEPVAWSPVHIVDPAGRQDRFPRAMARFRAADGRTGVGWIEFNQPQQLAQH